MESKAVVAGRRLARLEAHLRSSLPREDSSVVGTNATAGAAKREIDLSELRGMVGKELGVSSWHQVAQDRINAFAECTEDRQWIHVDVERAKKESPFKGPVAHGFLTLSLGPVLAGEANPKIKGAKMAVNYGLNKVRFISPVPAGSNVRLRTTLQEITDVPGGVQTVTLWTFEREGHDKPACVAESIGRFYF
ncbi:Acyl dehydratase [Balamuthia mandrillaris]